MRIVRKRFFFATLPNLTRIDFGKVALDIHHGTNFRVPIFIIALYFLAFITKSLNDFVA